MKVTKQESENRNWLWFKAFEKKLLVNFLKAQDFLITWRAFICSREFWNLSWLWMALLMKLCSLRITFSIGQGHRKKLMSWVSSHVPKRYLDKGFPDCFKDGILLCALAEKVANGACPRYDLLDPDQSLRNLKLAMYLIEKYVKIKPVITADEIFYGGTFAERKLVLLIAHMKLASEKLNLSANKVQITNDFMSPTTFISDKCYARGMGLLLAVRGRKACFNIVLDSTDNLDMVIEIRGPKNTACSKRITSVHALVKSDSQDIRDIQDAQIQQQILSKRIPLTYKILGRKITVYYSPLESGKHHMSIIWQGQHIMGSPYTITVDSSVEIPDIWYNPPKQGYNRLRRSDSQYYDETSDGRDSGLATCHESAGTVTRKRVLRYIVKLNGNDVVIDGKEDLCKAIKYLKHKEQNLSSEEEENWESQEEMDSDFSKCDTEAILKHSEEREPIPCTDNDAAFDNEFNEFFQSNVSNDTDMTGDSKYKSPQLLNSTSVSDCVIDNVTTKKYEEIFNKNESSFELNYELDYEQGKSFQKDNTPNEDFGRSEVSDRFCKDHNDISDIKTEKSVANQNISLANDNQSEQMPIFQVTFLEEKDESNSPFSTKDLSNNNMNLDIKDSSFLGDDLNFFPVHKVEYEMLHDDDSEDTYNFNQGRRTSFTELNEVNYLDDGLDETELVNTELDDNINSETEKVDYDAEELKQNDDEYQKEFIEYDGTGIRNYMRSSHSLFRCEHSLSLFTESVVETPPELATSENERPVPVSNIVDAWENELMNSKNESLFEDGKSMDDYKSDESTNVDYVDEGPSSNPFSASNDLEGFDPFSSPSTDINLFDSEDFDLNMKINFDLSLKMKRSSWDRDLLPSIRESSVEGLLEAETQDDKIRNREISENNSYFTDTKIKSMPDAQYIPTPTVLQNVLASEERHSTVLQNISASEERHSTVLQNISASEERHSTVLQTVSAIEGRHSTVLQNVSAIEERLSTGLQNVSDIEGRHSTVLQNVSAIEERLSTGLQNVSDIEGRHSTVLQNVSAIEERLEKPVASSFFKGFQPSSEKYEERKELNAYTNANTNISYGEKTDVSPKDESQENNKRSFSSMNILSASPYINRNQDNKISEIKFSTSAYADRYGSQLSPTIQPTTVTNTTSSNVQNMTDTFILTYAKPVIIDECLNEDEFPIQTQDRLKENVSDKSTPVADHRDSSEQKTAQCLSVKKVIQIFQKEKEEPVDTWPTEVETSPYCRKKFKDDVLSSKKEEKNDLPESENCLFTPLVEISRSSIKDRVKLFEREEKQVSSVKKHGTVEKRSSSSITAKKDYWESFAS